MTGGVIFKNGSEAAELATSEPDFCFSRKPFCMLLVLCCQNYFSGSIFSRLASAAG